MIVLSLLVCFTSDSRGISVVVSRVILLVVFLVVLSIWGIHFPGVLVVRLKRSLVIFVVGLVCFLVTFVVRLICFLVILVIGLKPSVVVLVIRLICFLVVLFIFLVILVAFLVILVAFGTCIRTYFQQRDGEHELGMEGQRVYNWCLATLSVTFLAGKTIPAHVDVSVTGASRYLTELWALACSVERMFLFT